jgi:hypothetical protein
MDVARDLHFMQDRRPPIICSGVLAVAAQFQMPGTCML